MSIKKEEADAMKEAFPLIWKFTDLDKKQNWYLLIIIRLVQVICITGTNIQADEYWQSIEPAYKSVYGDETNVWLPWEWSDAYRLRNVIYPLYLSIPLRLVKLLGIDYNMVVRNLPYLAHLPFVLINDWFVWKVANQIQKKDAARLSFLLLFFNRFQTLVMTRTFTNSIEQLFTVVSFYFFIDQKNKFTLNTVILTALISISFMIRNTSPVGWIPLLAIKVFREGSLVPFLMSGVFVAIPIILFCICVDTYFYQADTWVVTGYNFMHVNLVLGVSSQFGVNGKWDYVLHSIPQQIHFIYPAILFGLIQYFFRQMKNDKTPYLAYFSVFYLFFFSNIAHKEDRFLLPMFAFLFMFAGEYIYQQIATQNTDLIGKANPGWFNWLSINRTTQRRASFWTILAKLYIIWQIRQIYLYETKKNEYWHLVNLYKQDPEMHSVMIFQPLSAPLHTIFHRPGNKVKVYTIEQNPKFAQQQAGVPMVLTFENQIFFCSKTLLNIKNKKIRPQYITMVQEPCPNVSGLHCTDVCTSGLTSLIAEDGVTQLYSLFQSEYFENNDLRDRNEIRYFGPQLQFVFKLNKSIEPI